ncbi:MAG: restriction endonuclease [Patescibacteria group bacterium]
MKYWKIMPGQGAEYINQFIEKNIIAIGFADTDAVTRATNMQEMRRVVKEMHPVIGLGREIAHAGTLLRFYRTLSQGDRVLMYEPATRRYHIGEIISGAEFRQGEILRHVRQMRWQNTLSRDDFSPDARNALRNASTLFEISDATRDEIEKRLKGTQEVTTAIDETEAIQDIVSDVFEESQEFIKDALVKLGPYPMQDLVAGLLRAMGYKTRISPPGPDGGIDIFASPDGLGLEEPRVAVQVKHRPSTPTNADSIRAFITVSRNKKAKGIYVSTGGFTNDARHAADGIDISLLLMTLDDLVSIITQYYEQCDADTRALLPLRKLYWPLK